MRMRFSLLLLFVLLFNAVPSIAPAEEENLFDTEAATTYREQGLTALRHKNFDAAIEAFEDAVAASPDAESYYLLGYAYYLKGKAGDGDSRQKAVENFNEAYQIDPNFTPSKFKPEEMMAPQAGGEGEQTLGGMAPAGKQAATPAPETMSKPTPTAETPQPMTESPASP